MAFQNPAQVYSKSRRLGFRAGSLDRKPNTNRPMKNETTTYTVILSASICIAPNEERGLGSQVVGQAGTKANAIAELLTVTQCRRGPTGALSNRDRTLG
ncbi:hypothetical protein AMR42_01795 [Limnothrix sp. PR1529]|nr:hypothetical protein BCR12_00670 [Limnothrix sp. P13C2]PIB15262.1 hypothetical protein AMR42_01795 [Limnothrix sp. PR1529]